MSVGLPEVNDVILQAVNATVLKFGVPIIAAAGNEGTDACTNSPARSLYVISVGAVDSVDQVTSFSNFGRCVDGYSPGLKIQGASIGGDKLYTVLSGTSQAAPLMTGIAAMLMVDDPNMTWTGLRDYISTSYFRNSTTNARILQMPPISRVLEQRDPGYIKRFCDNYMGFTPYLAPAGAVAPRAALPVNPENERSTVAAGAVGLVGNADDDSDGDTSTSSSGNAGGGSSGLDTTTPV